MPKSSKIFLAIVFVLGITLVVGLAFTWLNSPRFRDATSHLPRSIAGRAKLSIENQSGVFQLQIANQERGELALDRLQDELAINNIKEVRLILTDELQANKLQYVDHDYFLSESYQITGTTLTVFLNVNPEEFQKLKPLGWDNKKLSQELEVFLYKNIILASQAAQYATGEDTSIIKARELADELDKQYDARLLVVF